MATLEEIAKKAGVSSVTVSNVLNGRNKEAWPSAKARAERIRRIAQKMGYRPNAAARAVARGRFQRVGMILPYGRSSYIPYGFISGLTHALAEHDYQLALDEIPRTRSSEAELPHVLTELSLDGLINFAPELTESVAKTLATSGLPSIWINDKREHNAVYPDEVDGARRLTRYLQELGHRRIAYIDATADWTMSYEKTHVHGAVAYEVVNTHRVKPNPGHYSATDRELGYVESMRAAGLKPDVRRVRGQCAEDHIVALVSMLREPDRPTALVLPEVADYHEVLQAVTACRLAVPRDLSVTSFTWGGPMRARFQLSCMRCWAPRVAELAAGMLIDLIRDREVNRPSAAYHGHMLIDKSTAPPTRD